MSFSSLLYYTPVSPSSKTYPGAPSLLLRCLSRRDIPAEQEPEQGAHKGLNKEKLGEESEGEVEAHQLQPVGQQGEEVEASVIGIIEPRRQEAHGRAHQPHRGADDGGLKQHRMGIHRIKHLAGQTEGAGTAHQALQSVGKAEFHQNDRPDGQQPAEHIHAALGIDGMDHGIRPGDFHQHGAVDHIQAVKHIGVDRDHNGDEGKDHSLDLISWHTVSSLEQTKTQAAPHATFRSAKLCSVIRFTCWALPVSSYLFAIQLFCPVIISFHLQKVKSVLPSPKTKLRGPAGSPKLCL